MASFKRWLFDWADDVLAYVLTIVGILFSSAIPLLRDGRPIVVDVGMWRVAVSAVIALMIVGKQEEIKADDAGSSTRARDGRRKRFATRMSNALAQGIMWSQFMNLAG